MNLTTPSRLLLLAASLSLAACASSLSENQLPCPCAEGWTCCEGAQLCVPDSGAQAACAALAEAQDTTGFCREPACAVEQFVTFGPGEGPTYADAFSFLRNEQAVLWGEPFVHRAPRLCTLPGCTSHVALFDWMTPYQPEVEPSWVQPVGLRGQQALVLMPGTESEPEGTLHLRWCGPEAGACKRAPDALVFQSTVRAEVLLAGEDVVIADHGRIDGAPVGSILRLTPGSSALQVLVEGGENVEHRFKQGMVVLDTDGVDPNTHLVVSEGQLYWRSGNNVWTCPLTGCPAAGPAVAVWGGPDARLETFFVEGGSVYWTLRGAIPGLNAEQFTAFRINLATMRMELLVPETRIGHEVRGRIAVDARALYYIKETFIPNDQGNLTWTGAELRACPGRKCDGTERVLLRGGTGAEAIYGLSAGPDGVFVHTGRAILRLQPYVGT